MKCFISYSCADKALAGDLNRQLVGHGVESFLAHETIEVAADWKSRILEELASADALIILLSKNCRASEWTGHEVGYFYAQPQCRNRIIPISLDGTRSYGIFGHVQSRPIPAGARCVPLDLWLHPLLDTDPAILIPVVIEKLAHCTCCRSSEAYMSCLSRQFASMPQASLDNLMTAAITNRRVYSATKCRNTLLPQLVQANSERLSTQQVEALQMKLDADPDFGNVVVLLP